MTKPISLNLVTLKSKQLSRERTAKAQLTAFKHTAKQFFHTESIKQ